MKSNTKLILTDWAKKDILSRLELGTPITDKFNQPVNQMTDDEIQAVAAELVERFQVKRLIKSRIKKLY